jgi:hypothetical protein
MNTHDHTPDPLGIGSSVTRADGSHIHAGECTICGKPVRRVAPFGVPAENNPYAWTIYDPADPTPLHQIYPVPEARVTAIQVDCLTAVHIGMTFRVRDDARWHTLAEVSEIDDDCHITLTTTEGHVAPLWATRIIQVRIPEQLTPEQEIAAARVDLQCTAHRVTLLAHHMQARTPGDGTAPFPYAFTSFERRAGEGDKSAARTIELFCQAAAAYEGARVALSELTTATDHDAHDAVCVTGADAAALREAMAQYNAAAQVADEDNRC